MGDGLSKVAYKHHADDVDISNGIACPSNNGEATSPSPSLKLHQRGATDTLIIFDWDDTLLCSSAINAREWSQEQMQQLERTAECVLQTAMSLGETLIVTNGNRTWVQDSSKRFLPRLVPTLGRLTVVSARANHELSYPGDPFSWKRQEFKEILARRQGGSCHHRGSGPAGAGLNLVVLGDSPAEIEAARYATMVVGGPSLVKTVKFKEGPSANELVGQLRKVLQELGRLVQEDHSASKSLEKRMIPANMDQLSSWASGWRLFEEDECTSPSWAYSPYACIGA